VCACGRTVSLDSAASPKPALSRVRTAVDADRGRDERGSGSRCSFPRGGAGARS
jgi:hypothetical protein